MDALDRGRRSYRDGAWRTALDHLVEADGLSPLGRDDLWAMAVSAYLCGQRDACVAALERAHHAHLDADDHAGAARCSFWLGMTLFEKGELGPSMGWLNRAGRILEGHDECVEHGLLLLPVVMQHRLMGELEEAHAAAGRAVQLAQRFADRDLEAYALHEQGRALVRLGRVDEGGTLLDEAMVAVTSGELSPLVTGHVYCSVIEGCREMYDFRRAHEWTASLARWCEAQPELVTFAGKCLVHRSQVLRMHGDWDDAVVQTRFAIERISQGADTQMAGLARYEEGEIYRLRGVHADAEAAYELAHRAGYDPQPGLALLRHAQGRTGEAVTALRRALDEEADPLRRAGLLAALADIAPGDAATVGDELEEIAARFSTPALRAMATRARGVAALSAGDARGALGLLREAWRAWQDLEVPYEAARIRVLLAEACRGLGDTDTADLELAAAHQTFTELGAAELAGGGAPDHGLSARELEVLRLVAAGRTNRAIASELVVSQRTVDRHVSNILRKLNVPSRAAASAYAAEHGLA